MWRAGGPYSDFSWYLIFRISVLVRRNPGWGFLCIVVCSSEYLSLNLSPHKPLIFMHSSLLAFNKSFQFRFCSCGLVLCLLTLWSYFPLSSGDPVFWIPYPFGLVLRFSEILYILSLVQCPCTLLGPPRRRVLQSSTIINSEGSDSRIKIREQFWKFFVAVHIEVFFWYRWHARRILTKW